MGKTTTDIIKEYSLAAKNTWAEKVDFDNKEQWLNASAVKHLKEKNLDGKAIGKIRAAERRGDVDYEEELKNVMSDAVLGKAEAQMRLGHLFDEGSNSMSSYYAFDKKSVGTAFAAEWFLKAAEQGNIEAQFQLGRQLEKIDNYLKENRHNENRRATLSSNPAILECSINWIRKAAEQGHVEAQIALGHEYTSSEPKQAVGWFLKAAEQGNVDAMYQMQHYYRHTDKQLSLKWEKRAVAKQTEITGTRIAKEQAEKAMWMAEQEKELDEWEADKAKRITATRQKDNPISIEEPAAMTRNTQSKPNLLDAKIKAKNRKKNLFKRSHQKEKFLDIKENELEENTAIFKNNLRSSKENTDGTRNKKPSNELPENDNTAQVQATSDTTVPQNQPTTDTNMVSFPGPNGKILTMSPGDAEMYFQNEREIRESETQNAAIKAGYMVETEIIEAREPNTEPRNPAPKAAPATRQKFNLVSIEEQATKLGSTKYRKKTKPPLSINKQDTASM